MSILASSVRSFWPPGLNAVTGNVQKGTANWILDEEFQILTPATPARFVTTLTTSEPFLSGLAADINRTATAAFESIGHATRSGLFPKSSAWLVIKSYYGAFFAAHALLRMLGRAFINLEPQQVLCINRIARLYGTLPDKEIPSGNFAFAYSGQTQEIRWESMNRGVGGVHEKFWSNFKGEIEGLAKEVLSSRSGTVQENQIVSTKLIELVDNLRYGACEKGTWLSFVRNNINYKHRFGTWFPYHGSEFGGIFEDRLVRHWREDPMSINLSSHGDRNFRRFQETCSFIIAACRSIALDMADRCPKGKSFHTYGWLAISRFCQQRQGRT